MRTELKKIASIQTGYSFRTRLALMSSGVVAVIQMKDLTEKNRVDCSGLVRIEMEKLQERHLVRPGDLVFRSRGLVSTSAILAENPGEAVVTAPLLRIRISHPSVLPEYLNWFINQPPAQTFLASHAKGTAQKMIDIQALERLEVFVPPIERQLAISELSALEEQEQDMMKRLADKRRKYISSKLMELAQGD